MRRIYRLILLTFVENFAIILIERGIYFYSKERLGFSVTANLWLALAFGTAYVLGALISNRISVRIGEKRLLQATIIGQLIGYAVLVVWPTPVPIYAVNATLGLFNGLKWPVVESYISAGFSPAQTARAVGWFNITWASAMLLSVVAAGPLIAWARRALFVVCGLMSIFSLLLTRPMLTRPVHMAHDHPDRPPPAQIARIRHLLRASRWSMFVSYAALFLLSPLMPRIFMDRLGFSVVAGTALSALLDAARVVAFVQLNRYGGWHNRALPLVVCLVALPAGFFMVLFGQSLWIVLAGEVLFGWIGGMVYYAALYYAMVAENASVDAGGGHEAMIGLGFAVGPTGGLIGTALAPAVGGYLIGVAVGIGPVFAVCVAGAGVALAHLRRRPPG